MAVDSQQAIQPGSPSLLRPKHMLDTTDQIDIFLSYAHEDELAAMELASRLKANGLTVWWDRELRVGNKWSNNIEQALERATRIAVLWSQASVVSPWVRAEALEGLQRNALLPIKIEDCVIPILFKNLQTLDLIGWPRLKKQRQITQLISETKAAVAASDVYEFSAVVDTSLSNRVARKVVEKIHGDTGELNLSHQLEVERSLADFAIQCTIDRPEWVRNLRLFAAIANRVYNVGIFLVNERNEALLFEFASKFAPSLNRESIKLLTDIPHSQSIDIAVLGEYPVAEDGLRAARAISYVRLSAGDFAFFVMSDKSIPANNPTFLEQLRRLSTLWNAIVPNRSS